MKRKEVCSILLVFNLHIRYRTYTGDDILFWTDRWLCEVSLAQKFPALFSLAANKEAKVKEWNDPHQNKVV